MKTNCENCPLRQLELFEDMTNDEVQFMSKFKTGEFVAQPGTELLAVLGHGYETALCAG